MNAKEEFLEEVKRKKVLCVWLTYNKYNKDIKEFNLPVKYTTRLYKEFLDLLDFNYDHSYGSQELQGIIWYIDGTWSERGEYDGSEWWEYKKTPNIPNDLLYLVKDKNEKQ